MLCSECADGSEAFFKGGYFIVLGVLKLSVFCFMVVVVLVGYSGGWYDGTVFMVMAKKRCSDGCCKGGSYH